MSGADSACEIRAAARYVRHLPQRQNPAARRDQFRQTLNIRKTSVIKRQFYDLRAGLLRHHQPGHKVGVMLGDANDNFIAGAQTRTGVTLRHHVDRFGGAACPDDTFFIGRV
ncbi:hypothetical protein LTSEALA_4264 [Salmonella enterica subsp. enterica serovar Alachua str. R6-377]|uniref:Uncharacterized protein n=1 Tax=Salmonella enterica subsp. enterica serovar Alachua str. R6-377 TaxID=913241 RepID=G5LT37_SALET|nr:hypothetical protein LTSEALA_4264 [Salmonella enterica subsp. enterica serovar Alachua str. R6-377]